VGSTLLERGRGSVEPTATGRVLEPYAKRILGLIDEARLRLASGESGEIGRLVIAASTIPGEYLLPPILAVFRVRHPRVEVDVHVSDSEEATAAVLAKEADVALVGKKPSDRRLTGSVFASDDIILVGTAASAFAPEGKLTIKQLADVPLILREQGSGTRAAIARLLPHLGERATSMRVGSTEAAKRCVQHGLGLAFLSRHAVSAELAAGLFQVIELPGTPVRRTFYAVRHRAVTSSAAAQSLLELAHQRNR
jgi:DNA-binding transcriptional LysR family regulator